MLRSAKSIRKSLEEVFAAPDCKTGLAKVGGTKVVGGVFAIVGVGGVDGVTVGVEGAEVDVSLVCEGFLGLGVGLDEV